MTNESFAMRLRNCRCRRRPQLVAPARKSVARDLSHTGHLANYTTPLLRASAFVFPVQNDLPSARSAQSLRCQEPRIHRIEQLTHTHKHKHTHKHVGSTNTTSTPARHYMVYRRRQSTTTPQQRRRQPTTPQQQRRRQCNNDDGDDDGL